MNEWNMEMKEEEFVPIIIHILKEEFAFEVIEDIRKNPNSEGFKADLIAIRKDNKGNNYRVAIELGQLSLSNSVNFHSPNHTSMEERLKNIMLKYNVKEVWHIPYSQTPYFLKIRIFTIADLDKKVFDKNKELIEEIKDLKEKVAFLRSKLLNTKENIEKWLDKYFGNMIFPNSSYNIDY
jgi:hypothetical protein